LFKLRNQSRSSNSVNALYGLCLGGSSLATKSGHYVAHLRGDRRDAVKLAADVL